MPFCCEVNLPKKGNFGLYENIKSMSYEVVFLIPTHLNNN
jgi:hypothetical protein